MNPEVSKVNDLTIGWQNKSQYLAQMTEENDQQLADQKPAPKELTTPEKTALKALRTSRVAVSLTFASLLFNIFLCNDNSKKWAKINEPNIILGKVEFIPIAQYSDSLPPIDYDYPLISRDDVHRTKTLYSYLQAFTSPPDKKKIETNRVFTFKDLKAEVAKEGYNGTAYVEKMQWLQFRFKNTGKTDATNVAYKINMTNDAGNWQTITYPGSGAAEIPHDAEPTCYQVIFGVPLNFNFPDSIKFTINLEYDNSSGQRVARHWYRIWVKSTFGFYE